MKILMNGKKIVEIDSESFKTYEGFEQTPLKFYMSDRNTALEYLISKLNNRKDLLELYAYRTGMSIHDVAEKISTMNKDNFDFDFYVKIYQSEDHEGMRCE